MVNAIRTLERRAVDAHRAGDTWTQFWDRHGGEVCRAEPHHRQRFQRLVRRLLALVASGDCDGQEPIDAEPWRTDDTDKLSDVGTQARCLLPLLAIGDVFRGCDCTSPCEVCKCQ
jgi:hypothetical protein